MLKEEYHVRYKKIIERKQHIISSAEVCLVRNGLVNTSVNDIALESNLGSGQIYRCFSNKDEIIREVLISLYHKKFERILCRCMSVGDIAGWLSDIGSIMDKKEQKLLLEFSAESINNSNYRITMQRLNVLYLRKFRDVLYKSMPWLSNNNIKIISEIVFIFHEGGMIRENIGLKGKAFLEFAYLDILEYMVSCRDKI